MTLSQMRATVFAQKPVLKRVLTQYGSTPLVAYFASLGADYRPKNVPLSRQKELIATLTSLTKQNIGTEAAKAIAHYFTKRYIVSTAAHHDFATHPFFSNYLIAAGYANQDANLAAIPVLSCAGISLNNSSFPRGLLYHDTKGVEQRLKVVSLKNHHHPVYGHPGFAASALPHPSDPKLHKLATDILANKALKGKTLSLQISLAVHSLVKKLPGLAKTEAIYLPQEKIAAALFIKHHLKSNTILHRIVFDASIRTLYLKKFEGITGAHSNRAGSHLFWALTNSQRVALRIQQNRLVSEDKDISIPLTPKAIQKALLTKQLMPTMGFTLTLLSFYYGLACAGGFSQVNYLSEMKTAYLALLSEVSGTETEVAIAQAVPTDLFAGDFVLATLKDKRTPATMIDIILDIRTNEKKLRTLLGKTTLKQATDALMPELYKIVTAGQPHA